MALIINKRQPACTLAVLALFILVLLLFTSSLQARKLINTDGKEEEDHKLPFYELIFKGTANRMEVLNMKPQASRWLLQESVPSPGQGNKAPH